MTHQKTNRLDRRVSMRRQLALVLSAFAAASISPFAPTQASAAEPGTAVAPTEALRLNPFEVVEQTDNSFKAHSVGTGGRLVLDLEDVPVQYSVINRAFIDALGITDLTEAASWAPGQSFASDAGNSGGNFDGQYGRFTQRGIQQVVTPNTTGTSGASNGVMRNFYQTNFGGNQDSYAVETFDFGQGPNGILFGGAGSMGQFQASAAGAGLAGVSSSQTKKARFDRARATVGVELGSFQYKRFTLDVNTPVTEKVGVRVNLVELDAGAWKFREQNHKRGLHLTTTWRMSNSTELTVEASNDYSSVNRPTLPSENFSGWDGFTVARGLTDSTMLPSVANTSAASLTKPYGSILGTNGVPVSFSGEPNGVTRFATADAFLWNQATNTIVNWRGMLAARRADSTSRVPLYTKTAPNGQFFVRGTRSASISNGTAILAPQAFGVSNRSWLNMEGLPGDMFDRVLAHSRARLIGFRENNTWEGDGTVSRNKDLQFSFAKSFGRRFAFGLGGDWNITKASGSTMDRGAGTPSIQLDLNQLLPDGTPNPGFLNMFSASGPNDGMNDQNSVTEDRALRGNLHYEHDLGRWGNYVFNVNANVNTRSYDFQFLRVYIVDAPSDPVLRDALKDPRNRERTPVRMQMYADYNKNLRDGRAPMVMNLVNSNWAGTGTESNTNAFVPTNTNSVVKTAFLPSLSDTGFHRALIQDFRRRDLALQTTARWFNNRVVFLGGLRRDYNWTAMRQQVPARYYPTIDTISRPEGYNIPLNVRYDGVSKYYKPIFPGSPQEYGALTYRVRDAAGNPVGTPRLASTRPTTTLPGGLDGGNLNGSFAVNDPRYNSDRFRDDYSPPAVSQYGTTKTYGATFHLTPWFAPFINKSDQILPIGPSTATTTTPNLDLFGNLQQDVVARGTDFGARFTFLGGRVSAKYNYYKATRYGNPDGNNVINNINTLINANRWDDTNPLEGAGTAINQLGIVPLNSDGDYSTTGNFGYEWELTAQVMSGLRLSVNGGAASTFTDTAQFYPLTHRYMQNPDRIDEFRRLLEDAGGSLDTSRKPINTSLNRAVALAPGLAVETPLAGKGVGLDTTAAVNAYNNLWIQYDNLGAERSRNRSQPTLNFFGDYTVQSGIARGLSIGAGVQWQGPRSIGNKGNWSIPYNDPVLGLVAIDDPTVDNRDLVWIDGVMRTQLNFGYTFQLGENRPLKVGLRIDNLGARRINYGAVLRQPEGDLRQPNRITMAAGNPSTVLDPVSARLTLSYSFGGLRGAGGGSR